MENEGRQSGIQILALLALLLLAAACIAADSRYRLELTRYELYAETLPEAWEGFRIVQLSDLHGSWFGRENERLIRLVRQQAPDLIALTGDFAGGPEDLASLESLLRGLEGLAPVYYVSGNHEWAGGVMEAVRQLTDRYGVHRLENAWEILERDGARMVIAGVEDPLARADQIRPDALAAQLRQSCPADFVLWLGHRNYWVKNYPKLPVDLILSGHAHGGVVRLPGLGGLLNNDHSVPAVYDCGVYESGSYRMVVSRGLGNSVPVPRLFNRPEVVCLVLHSGKANDA